MLTGSFLFSDEFEFAIARVRIHETAVQHSPLSSASKFAPADKGAVNDAKHDVNSLDIADESITNPGIINSEVFPPFRMPYSVGMDVHIIDAPNRLVAVQFEIGTRQRGLLGRYTDEGALTSTLGLVFIFDWKTGLSAVVDTGITFVSILSHSVR
jgi:hypothetical protein